MRYELSWSPAATAAYNALMLQKPEKVQMKSINAKL